MLLHVGSESRIFGDSNSFTVRLGENLTCKSVDLISCYIPNTIYNVRSNVNNKINFTDTNGTFTLTMTAGSYDSVTFCSSLLTQLNAVAGSAGTFTAVSISDTTMKCTVTNSGAFSLLFSSGSNASKSLRTVMGFGANDTTSGTSCTGTNVVSLGSPLSLGIRISEIGIGTKMVSGGEVTWLVPFGSRSIGGEIMSYDGGIDGGLGLIRGDRINLNTLNVRLLHTDMSDVDLNGSEWQMVLKVM